MRYIVAVLLSERPEATDCPHAAHAIIGIALAQVHVAIGDIAIDDDGKAILHLHIV
ncbi:MAG TPA: hypothetical protein VGV41_03225 [Pseudolabrys sp.]|uniref:hypothetical protein n=1 Tax=Pseudolabrys sp. TaxID=1960880 RepID=UPI002DDD4BAD|nr:hypothetical protein [Pseudolabrys sp.]HEV2627641.1 hypothetical protein [Pseudolabrys sp.]